MTRSPVHLKNEMFGKFSLSGQIVVAKNAPQGFKAGISWATSMGLTQPPLAAQAFFAVTVARPLVAC